MKILIQQVWSGTKRFWISIKLWADTAGRPFEWEEYEEPFLSCYKIKNWWQEQKGSARLYEYNLKGGSLKSEAKEKLELVHCWNRMNGNWHLLSISFVPGTFTYILSHKSWEERDSPFYCHECLGTVLKLISSHQTKVYLTQKPFPLKQLTLKNQRFRIQPILRQEF